MNELCEVIQERLNGSMKNIDDEEQKTQNIAYLKKVFDLFTKNGLKAYLSRYEDGEINQVINYYR